MKKFVVVVLFVVSLLFVLSTLAEEPKPADADKCPVALTPQEKWQKADAERLRKEGKFGDGSSIHNEPGVKGDPIAPSLPIPGISNAASTAADALITGGDKLLEKPESVAPPDTRDVPKEILDASPPTMADKLPNTPGQATISADPVAEKKAVAKAKPDKSKADKPKKNKAPHKTEKLDHPDKPQKDTWDNPDKPGTFRDAGGGVSMAT